jgi:hypothetical protein
MFAVPPIVIIAGIGVLVVGLVLVVVLMLTPRQ